MNTAVLCQPSRQQFEAITLQVCIQKQFNFAGCCCWCVFPYRYNIPNPIHRSFSYFPARKKTYKIIASKNDEFQLNVRRESVRCLHTAPQLYSESRL